MPSRKFGDTYETVLVGLEVIMDEFGNIIIEKNNMPLKEFREHMDKFYPEFDGVDDVMIVLRDAQEKIDDLALHLTSRYGVVR